MAPRTPTGIQGFDDICHGGLVQNRTYLVTGSAGAGKTLFGLQYLHAGVVRHGQNGIFLATDESPELIKEDARGFGWDFDRLEAEKKIAFIDATGDKMGMTSRAGGRFDMDSIIDRLITTQQTLRASRAVVDSSTSIASLLGDPARFRIELLKLGTTLRKLGLTSLVIAESSGETSQSLGTETFLTDGVIALYFRRILDTRIHSVEIYKMRGSAHSHKIHPFEITPQGIVVNATEGVFGEF
ncbi:MAG: circadian clock protein KaiC [Euryarchaeota archaeon]|nr:circadian clock protein KaiC [Euryarchaeota archaeon]